MTWRWLFLVRRLTVPGLLAGVVAFLQLACIPVPAFSHRTTYGAAPPETQVGGPASGRPVQVGRSTREDVVYLLGPPMEVTVDGRALFYEYEVVKGYLVSLIPVFVFPQTEREYLRLRFDADGRLAGYNGRLNFEEYYDFDRGQRVNYRQYQMSTGAPEGALPLPPLAPPAPREPSHAPP